MEEYFSVCVSEVCVHLKMQIRSAVNRPVLRFLDSFTLPTFSAAAFVLAGSKPEQRTILQFSSHQSLELILSAAIIYHR